MPRRSIFSFTLHFMCVIDDAKYSGHTHLCVCVSVHNHMPTLLHGPGCNLGESYGCPIVVQYWVDLQSVHGFHCYDNMAQTQNVSECSVLALCLVVHLIGVSCYWHWRTDVKGAAPFMSESGGG